MTKIKFFIALVLSLSSYSVAALECELFARKCTAVDGLIFSSHSGHHWTVDYSLGYYSPFIYPGDSHVKKYYCLPYFNHPATLRVEYNAGGSLRKEKKSVYCGDPGND